MTTTDNREELYRLFREKAQGVGAEVHRFEAGSAALAFLLPLLTELGVAESAGAYALWSPGPLAAASGGDVAAVPGLRLQVSRELAADALVGISEVDWALADTGSVVQDQSRVTERLVSSLPVIHVAVLGTDRILPDKAALFSRIDPTSSKYIAFITGPSRTADIERVLTIGVHGPKRLIVLVVDELRGENR